MHPSDNVSERDSLELATNNILTIKQEIDRGVNIDPSLVDSMQQRLERINNSLKGRTPLQQAPDEIV